MSSISSILNISSKSGQISISSISSISVISSISSISRTSNITSISSILYQKHNWCLHMPKGKIDEFLYKAETLFDIFCDEICKPLKLW